ncbi:hypothetical protein CQ018_05590 [Arthrobacter sp. MYb227]|uniref:DUF6069 family protein n=1 Tax=Arthrobacter sp. MYb227 TaxID=1848601 RepID=UPI000CFD60C1|nr:DUF6069 family protein [Arthrobacter sp. MYb227]PQZ94815.1 hypothetical protein CQ018_05590 [Arthrobacter sp. MYb227]
MTAQVQPYKKFKMPFNYVQVLIAAFGAIVTSIFVYFVSETAGASMFFSGGLFPHLTIQEIAGFIFPTFVILGFLTFLIGRASPRFCKVAQWLGVAIAVISMINPILFAQDLASGIGLAVIHLVVGASWYLAVNYSNKKYNDEAARNAEALARA